MSAAELVAHHRAHIGVDGVVVRVVFPDQAGTIAFRDELLLEANEIPRGAIRLIRTMDLLEGPEPNRAVLELVDGDGRAHRFFVGLSDLDALATIRLVAQRQGGSRAEISPTDDGAVAAEPLEAPPQQEAETERQDDLRELALLRTRLGRAERAIRHQRQQLNSLRSAFAKRFGYATGRYPSYCCQRCGEQIGWIGRAFQAIGVPLHACRTEREEA